MIVPPMAPKTMSTMIGVMAPPPSTAPNEEMTIDCLSERRGRSARIAASTQMASRGIIDGRRSRASRVPLMRMATTPPRPAVTIR